MTTAEWNCWQFQTPIEKFSQFSSKKNGTQHNAALQLGAVHKLHKGE